MSCTRKPAGQRSGSRTTCCITAIARSSRPGTHAHRPGVVTPLPGLLLAGDGVRIDLPVALMERAATTGWTAANHLLDAVGTCRPRPEYGSHPRPFGATALSGRPRKAFATMSIGDNMRRRWPKDWPLQAIPPVKWADQRPTYREASPGDHRRRAGPVAAPADRQLVHVRGEPRCAQRSAAGHSRGRRRAGRLA